MKKRKWIEESPATITCAPKKQKMEVKVYENPWKAAKGEGKIKYVDVIHEHLKPALFQKPGGTSPCFTSSSELSGDRTYKKGIPSFKRKNKLESSHSSSQQSQGCNKNSRAAADFVKPLLSNKNSLNETLVSTDSHETPDSVPKALEISLISEGSALNSQPSQREGCQPTFCSTPLVNSQISQWEGYKRTFCSTPLAQLDPDREHTNDSFTGREWLSREPLIKRKDLNPNFTPESLQFICPTNTSSIKQTPARSSGPFTLKLSSPKLTTQQFTPVDQPIEKINMLDMDEMVKAGRLMRRKYTTDINEALMAGRLIRPEKKVKERRKRVLTLQNLPLKEKTVLLEPPVNCFLSYQDEKSPIASTKPQTKRNPKYGSSSKFLREYKVIKRIGSGSFGSVFKVVSRNDGCTYALKKMNKMSISLKLRTREMLCMSAIWAQGSCESLVKYFCGWTEDDIVYTAMEYCEKGSLEEFRSTNLSFKFTYSILRKLIQQIASGLAYMHSMQMVHMDIKPGNILISDNWNFKLGDFGHTVKLSKENGNPIYPVRDGDVRYISKEVLKEDYNDLPKSDIFSLGASVYELARGKALPRKGKQWSELRNGRFHPVEGYPEKLNNCFLSCMAILPTNRPSAQDICSTIAEPATRDEKKSLSNDELQNLESTLETRNKEIDNLKAKLSKQKEKAIYWQGKFNQLVEQCKQSSSKQQFNLCKSFSMR